LFGYVYWCLEKARENGIRRLYFIARDGQILLKIAKIIALNWGYDIDCRYLYGSRQSWHPPAILDITEVELDWIFDPTHFLSVTSVCKRVNLNPIEIKEHLIESGFLAEMWHDNLDVNKRELLKQSFVETQIREIIIAKAHKYRDTAIEYFRQEGMMDGTTFAIVDIGWNGRLQISLNKILNAAKMYPKTGITGFYFGLSRRAKAFDKDCLQAYFYDKNSDVSREQAIQHALIEVFVSADHGSTIGFEEANNSAYRPILKSMENKKAIDWGVVSQQSASVIYAELVTEVLSRDVCKPDYFVQITEDLLKLFTKTPTQSEADVYGRISMTEDQTDDVYYELAEELNRKDYLRLILQRRMKHSNLWIHGSVARQNSLMGKSALGLYEFYLKFRQIVAKLIR
jgi:predicted HAD superfamily hydrolase